LLITNLVRPFCVLVFRGEAHDNQGSSRATVEKPHGKIEEIDEAAQFSRQRVKDGQNGLKNVKRECIRSRLSLILFTVKTNEGMGVKFFTYTMERLSNMCPFLAAAKFNLEKNKSGKVADDGSDGVMIRHLPLLKSAPLAAPNVESATKTGMIHATSGITYSAHVWKAILVS
jgi:hypothetical protein